MATSRAAHPAIATCRICKGEQVLYLYAEDVERWQNGEHIQDVMPYLSAGERELLISQTCDKCWKELYSWPE